MKKMIGILSLLLLPLLVSAQYNEPKLNRWEFGGSFGLNFGNTQTSINVNPQIGYRFTDYFTAGGGMNYAYYRRKNTDSKSNYLGINAYMRVNPIPYIQLFAQPEVYRRWGETWGEKDDDKVFATLLLGGGLSIPMPQGAMNVSVYYDVIQDKYSPYKNEVMYSIGYTFYF